MDVTVIVLAYNIESFIEECLLSIKKQDINFSMEVLIGEDCSTDDTLQVIEKLNLPPNFRVYARKKNLGLNKNNLDLISKAHGKYIAICDGDDYWTQNNKLQLQYDFLEKNDSFSGCFTNAKYLERHQYVDNPNNKNIPQDVNFNFLLWHNVVTNSSVMYRNQTSVKNIANHIDTKVQDYYIHLTNLTTGSFRYIPEELVCYRIHENGDFNGIGTFERLERLQSVFKSCLKVDLFQKNRPIIRERLAMNYYSTFRFSHGKNIFFRIHLLTCYFKFKLLSKISRNS
jgi:glycosyltransferase involved in cell wall biosynthesis